jgi:hypothetical protein
MILLNYFKKTKNEVVDYTSADLHSPFLLSFPFPILTNSLRFLLVLRTISDSIFLLLFCSPFLFLGTLSVSVPIAVTHCRGKIAGFVLGFHSLFSPFPLFPVKIRWTFLLLFEIRFYSMAGCHDHCSSSSSSSFSALGFSLQQQQHPPFLYSFSLVIIPVKPRNPFHFCYGLLFIVFLTRPLSDNRHIPTLQKLVASSFGSAFSPSG